MTILILLAMAFGTVPAADGVVVRSADVSKQGNRVAVSMDMDFSGIKVPSNKAVLLSPVLVSADKELQLPAVGLYSRGRFLQYERMGTTMSGSDETSFRTSRMPANYHYETFAPWEDWMKSCTLELREHLYGCCGNSSRTGSSVLYAYDVKNDAGAAPVVVVRVDTLYIDREVVVDRVTDRQELVRSVEGRAFLDYALNQTGLDPEYHSNGVELKSMLSTIESVLQNKGWEMRKIIIKGYASPEGPYDNNVRLAASRTEAVKNYIAGKYGLPEQFFELESVPENWEGLRNFVDASSLPHRAEILEIIDGNRAPDDKEWMIKSRYPEDFKTLLEQCLPYLRRTDYRIEYEIKEQ